VTVQSNAGTSTRLKELAVAALCAGVFGAVVYVLFPSVALLLAAVAIGLGVFAFRESETNSSTRRIAAIGIGVGVAVFVTWGVSSVFFSSGSVVGPNIRPTLVGSP
jgi:hypothetical protein